jgi:hypothetical protein
MNDKPRTPGISRDNRLSDEGLQRLERQLQSGSQITDAVLTQWIRRYGEPARAIIRRHSRYHVDLEPAAGGETGK